MINCSPDRQRMDDGTNNETSCSIPRRNKEEEKTPLIRQTRQIFARVFSLSLADSFMKGAPKLKSVLEPSYKIFFPLLLGPFYTSIDWRYLRRMRKVKKPTVPFDVPKPEGKKTLFMLAKNHVIHR